MSRSNPLLWPKPPLFWRYGFAVLSVITALKVTQWPQLRLEESPLALFVFAVLFSAWFGGAAPGLLATALSSLAFDYYFLHPVQSLALKPASLPRLIGFVSTLLLVGLLSAAQRRVMESLQQARDDLKETVRELRSMNDALQTESRERKQAEDAMRQAQADLARVNRVTTLGELTASLAHEVNQPIAAAVTNANTCLRWLTRDQPDLVEAREAALRIVKDGTRAAEIISRVRLLFKKGNPELGLVDINEVIREMIVLLRAEATRHNILVATELAADLPQVMVDRVQLQQVLMNLIVNSIDAMKDVDGLRELTIKSHRAEKDQLLVSVNDTGVGLPTQDMNQIFKAFFTTKSDGTGMGLSISRSIIEAHGGRLWAGDNSPRGAIFRITIPVRKEMQE